MPQTIALVDDDRNILTSVQMTLEQEGYTVRTYTDGESALQGLMARPADLAVLDIKMPRMDGMELLQRLRQRSAVPVIFLTSKDEEVDELMGLRLGADDYITKPFSQRLLLERIRALLRRNESSRAEGSGAPYLAWAPSSGSYLLTYHAWQTTDAFAQELDPDGVPAGERTSVNAAPPSLGTFATPVAASTRSPEFFVAMMKNYNWIAGTIFTQR